MSRESRQFQSNVYLFLGCACMVGGLATVGIEPRVTFAAVLFALSLGSFLVSAAVNQGIPRDEERDKAQAEAIAALVVKTLTGGRPTVGVTAVDLSPGARVVADRSGRLGSVVAFDSQGVIVRWDDGEQTRAHPMELNNP